MLDELQRRNYSPSTARCYLHAGLAIGVGRNLAARGEAQSRAGKGHRDIGDGSAAGVHHLDDEWVGEGRPDRGALVASGRDGHAGGQADDVFRHACRRAGIVCVSGISDCDAVRTGGQSVGLIGCCGGPAASRDRRGAEQRRAVVEEDQASRIRRALDPRRHRLRGREGYMVSNILRILVRDHGRNRQQRVSPLEAGGRSTLPYRRCSLGR